MSLLSDIRLIATTTQISGDGHLPSTASSPDSSDSTRFDSLEVYLVSYTAKLNLTVSQGPGLLTQEPGSTVKHINWLIDTCIESGNYNVYKALFSSTFHVF